ncbi:MAG: hypothetical protein AAFY17_06085 [Cyanobacteria bacterium J06642_11]
MHNDYLTSLGFDIRQNSHQVRWQILRLGQAKETYTLPTTLSGDNVLPGFTLKVTPF